MNSVANIVVEPVDALFGAQHRVAVTCIENENTGEGGSLDGTYFLFSTPSTDFYIYTGTDPELDGKTGISYSTDPGDSAEDVASAIETAINAAQSTNRFHARARGATVV